MAAVVPLIAHAMLVPLNFNQFMLQRLEIADGTTPFREAWRLCRSAHSSGWNALTRSPSQEVERLDNPREVFDFVFTWVPSYAVVYPTEGFYYFYGNFSGRDVWGNLRVADLDRGELGFAYFTTPNQTEEGVLTLGASDGVEIERFSDHMYDVRYAGREIRFVLSAPSVEKADALILKPAEEIVAAVHDESGVHFVLLYNGPAKAFYYVLDEARGGFEDLVALGDSLFIGRRTGFVYQVDRDHPRRLLVGVSLDNVKRNNFLDGPGDQVPFRADLRDRLHDAYPNTYLDDGIDAHGVWQGKSEWVRVAITPYLRYVTCDEVREQCRVRVKEHESASCWDRSAALTREWWNTAFWREMILQRLERDGKGPYAARENRDGGRPTEPSPHALTVKPTEAR